MECTKLKSLGTTKSLFVRAQSHDHVFLELGNAQLKKKIYLIWSSTKQALNNLMSRSSEAAHDKYALTINILTRIDS